MNNLPLQPLVWDGQNYTQSAFHQYLVRKDDEAKKNSKSQYVVNYGRLNTQKNMNVATGFATIDEAKAWAWDHYNKKMQPYVKPLPTWIDVSERLPEEGGKYLVCFGLLKSVANSDVDNFNAKTKQWEFYNKDDLPRVIAWMPIPEFSTMQNLHKGGDCESN